jgi:WD40 repeat protein
MKAIEKSEKIQRREFLRGMAGGALALGAGPLLASSAAAASPTPFRLFLTTFLAGSVIEVKTLPDGSVQSRLLAQFGHDSQGRVETTAGVVVGHNDTLFVFSPGSDQVFVLDINTGAVKSKITSLTISHDGAIGSDGLLYALNAPSLNGIVGSGRPDSIERFDASTGAHIDTFIDSNTTPEIRGPFGLTWGPDGDLYVASVLAYGFNPGVFPFRPDHISRFDGKTGQFKGFVVRETHLSFTMVFHPNGKLLVPSHFFNRVYMYDTSNGRLVDAFADVPYPISLAFGPDGDLYVTSFSDANHIAKLLDNDMANDYQAQGGGSIQRFNGVIGGGTAKSILVSGVPFAGFIAFA